MNYNTNCGIYKITNLINGKVYIGSSKNIRKRWKEHKWELKNNRHNNKKMQSAYNKYGEESFDFSVVLLVESENDLRDIEMDYIVKYNALDRNCGFNISESTKGVCLTGDKHHFFGKKMPEERKKRISQSVKGEKHPLYGTTVSQETKDKMRKTLGDKLKFSNHPNALKIVQLTLDGEFVRQWDCGSEASLAMNRERSSLTKVLKGKQKTYAGYKWMYLEEYEQTKSAN